MPEPALASKEMKELRRRFKRGYFFEATSKTSNELHVVNPDGEYVARNGSSAPIALHQTPRSGAWRIYERDLMEAGVLKPPRTKTPQKKRTEDQEKRAAALRQMVLDRSKRRQVEAQALRDRLQAALEPVGGLELPGMPADLAWVGAWISRERGDERLLTPDLTQGSIHRLIHGGWIETRYQEIWNEIARRLEETDDSVDVWFTLVRQARGLPEEAMQIRVRPPSDADSEWPFVVELLPVEALVVDHDYQRPVPWPFVRKLASTYDESLVGTIDVAERRRGAVFAILDGQLRFEASKLVGKTTVWASIYSGLDKASEARFFLHKNKDRKVVHPYYTFRARVVAAEPAALEIEKIVSKFGYKLAIGGAKPGTSLEKNISAIAAVEKAYEYKRPDKNLDCLTPALETLKASTLGMEYGQSNVLIRGLARLFSAYADDEIDRKHLERVIAESGPTLLLSRARETARHSGGNAENYMARELVNTYNRGLTRDTKLSNRL